MYFLGYNTNFIQITIYPIDIKYAIYLRKKNKDHLFLLQGR